jgi:hypothetical protein
MAGQFIADTSTAWRSVLGENQDSIDLLNKLMEWLQEAEGSIPETRWNEEAKEDYDFYAGIQDSKEVIDALIAQKRPTTTFNEIKPKIDMLVGMADQVRREPTVLPVGFEDQALAEIMNETFKHFRYLQKAGDKEMNCFEHSTKSGRSFLHYFVDASNPFEPEIKCMRVPGRDVFLDPNSIEYDMSDAQYIGINKWFTEDELKQYIPDFDGTVVNASQIETTAANRPTFFDPGTKLYRLIEMWYTVVEEAVWFINPLTGKPDNLAPEDFKQLAKKLKEGVQMETGQTLQVDELVSQKSHVKRKYFCLFSGPYILAQGRSPYRHDFYPIVLFGAYKNEDLNVWFGATNPMKDGQVMLNTMRRQYGHLLQSQPKGLLMEEVGAIQNRDEYMTDSAKPNFILSLARGALNKIKFAEQPQINPLYGQLDAVYQQSMKDVSGIQDQLMGVQTASREPGVTHRMRLESSVAVLYILFSNFRKSRIQAGKIQLAMIQQYMTQPYVIRLEGQKGMELMQINTQMNPASEGFNDISAGKFDLVIDEEAENVTMRRGIAQMLMDMASQNPDSIPPDIILEYLDLPFSVKEQVREYNEARIARETELQLREIEAKTKSKTEKEK